jgi:mannose-1-phosphate guanylyltransferase
MPVYGTHPWTIVLAAGEGTRLRALTRALHGEDLPKQFAVIQGRHSLLQTTLQRTSRFAPPESTVVVVAQDRERLAREQLEGFEGVDVVAQPKNVGTGPGLLLPLSRVMARDPDAIVVVVPADHFVREPETFVGSVREAEAVARSEDGIVLLAAVPEAPETQYGWIRSAPGAGRGRVVTSFVEKPNARTADELYRSGALWNTFVMVGSARRFYELARRCLPEQTALFERYRAALGSPSERAVLSRVYERMPAADFSRDVLEKAGSLRVVPLAPCGWSDWGTPERVLTSLHESGEYEAFVARAPAIATVRIDREGSLRRDVVLSATGT